MKTIKVNGVSINISDAEYKKYLHGLAESKKSTKSESKKLSIPDDDKSKSVSPTYSDYTLRAMKSGAEIAYISDFLTVVYFKKQDTYVAEITAPIKKVYQGIKMSIKEHGGKWCGNHDKKVFTYTFEDSKNGAKFVADQKKYDKNKKAQ